MAQSLSGKPDYIALEKANRVSHNQTRGFDRNPNPMITMSDGSTVVRGHAKESGTAWRVGLSAEEYFKLFRQMLINKVNGGDTKFMSKLDPDEGADFLSFLKEKAPDYLRFKMELSRLGVPLMTEDEVLAMLPAELVTSGDERKMVEAEQGTTELDEVAPAPKITKKKMGRPAKEVKVSAEVTPPAPEAI